MMIANQSEARVARRRKGVACALLILAFFCGPVHGQDPASVISGFQRRYASIDAIKGSFEQTFRAPGIEQVESGEFWLKRPGLMRWAYRRPEEKLFVADGRESFLYIPEDRQVTIQPLTAADLRNTPFDFLLGRADIAKSFRMSKETEFNPIFERSAMVRLTPLRPGGEYAFLTLEIDAGTFELRRLVVRETGGNASEFVFRNIAANVKMDDKLFQFKVPKGVEIVRFDQ